MSAIPWTAARPSTIALILLLGSVGLGVHMLTPSVSPMIVAIMAGILVSNAVAVPAASREESAALSRQLLKFGVVLLGLQLSSSEILNLGVPRLAAIGALSVLVFAGTIVIGRAAGVSTSLSVLIAAGSAVCGASAIIGVAATTDASDEDIGLAIAGVTLMGTLTMLGLPWLATQLGYGPTAIGGWIGLSVHEVGQVVAAASVVGPEALTTAIITKMTRVALLAPLVTLLALRQGTRNRRRKGGTFPAFVVWFIAAAALASTGAVPPEPTALAGHLATALLTAALGGLGLAIRITDLRKAGHAALLLTLAASGLALVVGLLATEFGG